MKKFFITILLASSFLSTFSQRKIITTGFADFSKNWITELEDNAASAIKFSNDSLFIDSKAGATVWLKRRLYKNVVIEYDRKVLLNNVQNKRLSDVNQFWMATDSGYENPFHFSGKLSDYDRLSLYYFGFGGNSNKTTRFRKYEHNNRNLLTEYKDSSHLLQYDKIYHIKTAVIGNRVLVWINRKLYFDYTDKNVLKEGYFGFRLTWSAQVIKNFIVYQPDEKFIRKIEQ